ncbi:predicted protein [Naegleria gruberi]|uniref:Predicted protein n=1 Tax=Naegleria gruberi TaxID=5762 RepID=D2W5W1_NAEGR|nr:uncharacterized protein NAEGRDRAFT_54864 [Naegleria gruberi]EFC35541.1 predicted protein [Naegleria gruberi]|eukprot:XP_002668285.1 predicted protein [Naegleria gruberi strain NEG-M]
MTKHNVKIMIADLGEASKLDEINSELSEYHSEDFESESESSYASSDEYGTNGYRDPIVYQGLGKWSVKSDIWSFEKVCPKDYIEKEFEKLFTEINNTELPNLDEKTRLLILENEIKSWKIIKNIILGMLTLEQDSRWDNERIFQEIFNDTTEIDRENFESNYKNLKSEFLNNESVVMSALSEDGLNLKYVPTEMHEFRNVILRAINQNASSYQFIRSKKWKYSKNVMEQAVKKDARVIELIPKQMVMYLNFESDLKLELPKKTIQDYNDLEKMKKMVNIDGTYLQYATDTLKGNVELVTESVKNRGIALQFASNTMRSNYDICYLAVSQNPEAIQFVDDSLQQNEKIVEIVSSSSLYSIKTLSKLPKIEKTKEELEKGAKEGNADDQNRLGVLYYNEKDISNAAFWYDQSAKQGHGKAQFNLGLLYYMNSLMEPAKHWFLKSAEQGYADAQFNLGVVYETDQFVDESERRSQLEQAFIWYMKSAEQGHANAQGYLAQLYEYGRGVERDYSKTIEWYTKSAEQGFVSSQFNLALMLHLYERDAETAFYWMGKAAENGHTDAQFNLGWLYLKGIGTVKDYSKGFEILSKLMPTEDSEVLFNLAYCYYQGFGTEKNIDLGLELFLKAAENGHIAAQYNIGMIYLEKQDYQKAFEWFKQCEVHNDPNSLFQYALFYYNGSHIVEKDYTKAFELFLRSAEQGHAQAQYNLALLYFKGIGIDQDYSKAKEWFLKSSENGLVEESYKYLEEIDEK